VIYEGVRVCCGMWESVVGAVVIPRVVSFTSSSTAFVHLCARPARSRACLEADLLSGDVRHYPPVKSDKC
jgi:hypothetical protein